MNMAFLLFFFQVMTKLVWKLKSISKILILLRQRKDWVENAMLYPINKVRNNITEGVKDAVSRIKGFKTLKPKYPVTLRIEFKHWRVVDGITPLPGRKIINSKTVEYKPKGLVDFLNYL